MQAMWSNALNSDVVKNVVALGTELIKIIDRLKPIYLLISGIAVYLNKKYNFVDFENLFAVFKDALLDSKSPKDFFKNLISGFKNTGLSIDEARIKLEELKEKRDQLGDPKSEKNKKKYDALTGEIDSIEAGIKAYDDLIAKRDEVIKKRDSAKAQMDSANADLAYGWSQGEFGAIDEEELDRLQKKANETKEAFEKADLEVQKLNQDVKLAGKTGKNSFAGLSKSVKAFGKQVVSVITQMLVMLAITKAIELLINFFDSIITTAAEAAEEYEKINGELKDLKDNLKTIESELSAIDDKMADLIAKGSLTFVEQEELDRLRAEREELERTLELNQQLAKQKQQQVNNQTSDQIEYYRNKGVKSGKTTGERAGSGALTGTAIGAGAAGLALSASGGAAGLATALGVTGATQAWNPVGWGLLIAAGIVAAGTIIGTAIGTTSGVVEEKVGESIDNMEEKLAKKEEEVRKAREKYQKSGKDSDKEKYEEAQQALSNYRGEMAQYFTELDAFYQNVDLSVIEDPDEYNRLKEEMNDFYNERDKWLIKSGAEGAESNAIERIFSKDDYEDAYKTIDTLVKKLKKDPTNQSVIRQISEQCEIAEEDLAAVGLSVQDAKDYFTMLGQNAAFGTIEGKVAEITSATSRLQTLLSDTKSTDFTGLFGQGGEISKTAIAEYFQGTSEETREEISRLVKAINDSEIDVENALKQFEFFGIESTLDIYIGEVQTNFKDVFVELDGADGLIDTFKELGEAIGSTANALKVFNKAEAEMAYSGRVSIQTALELMEYTDDYGSILEVVDGKLRLVDNAEEVLIQTRIDAIKTSAQASLEDATSAYEKAKLATATYKTALDTDMSAEVVAKSWEKVLAAGAGLWEGIKSLVSDESWTEAYNRGYNATLSNITGYETVYDDSGLQALAEAEAEARSVMEAAEDRVNLANQLTPETLEAINDADDLDNVDDAKQKVLDELMDKFQRAMDYWENRISANQARYEQLQNEIDLLESRGKIVGKEYYAEQVKIEKERLDLLVKQRAEAKSYLNSFAEGSDEWWEVSHTLNDLEGEIDGVTSSVEDLSEAMRNVDVQIFEEIVDRFSQLSDELSNIRDILSSEDMFDEEGNWTKAGIAVLGTHLQDIEMYKKGLSEVEEELDYLLNGGGEDDYSGNEQAYYDRVKELTNQQHEYTKAIHDSEQSVVDMYESNVDAVEEYTDKLVESYQDYIDNVKEALDAERDLYEFKKNVKKQTKDIASLERRIASLSGSTNAGDIAERRRLEADLYGAREELDDTYYDHAKQTQQDALDAEAEAYEETMNRFVEGMRISLAEATVNMGSFLNRVTIAASMNADAVLEKYEETGLKLSPELTNPWVAAKNAIGEYGQGAIDLMNKWTQDGYWTDFTTKTGKQLSSPWATGTNAVIAFEESVGTVMTNVVSDIEKNVQSASTKLSNLYQQIIDTKKEAQNIDTGSGNGGDSGYYESTVPDYHYNEGSQTESAAEKKENARKAAQAYVDKKGFSEGDKARWGQDLQFRPLLQALIKAGGSINDLKGKVYTVKTSGKIPGEYSVSGINLISLGADDITVSLGGKSYKAALSLPNNGNVVDYQINKDFGGKTPANGKLAMLDGVLYVSKNNHWYKVGSKNDGSALTSAARNKLNGYAKGTTGTKRDEWAITDEPQFGDELVLVPGKDGNLSFMRKGTGVVPADLTANLMEWGKFDPSSMNLGGGVNVNMINNAVNKPEFNLSVDNFLRCDNVSQDSLPELKQFVKEQMNSLVKQMNYSLKKSGAR